MSDKWAFHNQEDGVWNHCCDFYDTPEDAAKDGMDYGFEPGDTVYVGRVDQETWSDLIDTPFLLDHWEDRIFDACGEACSETFDAIGMEDIRKLKDALVAAIETWAANCKPPIVLPFRISHVKAMGVVPEEIAGEKC